MAKFKVYLSQKYFEVIDAENALEAEQRGSEMMHQMETPLDGFAVEKDVEVKGA